MVLGAKGAPIVGEQSVVQSRRDDEAMHSIVEEEQRRVGGGGPPRMVCDLSRAPLATGELPAIRCIRNPALTPHPSVLLRRPCCRVREVEVRVAAHTSPFLVRFRFPVLFRFKRRVCTSHRKTSATDFPHFRPARAVIPIPAAILGYARIREQKSTAHRIFDATPPGVAR